MQFEQKKCQGKRLFSWTTEFDNYDDEGPVTQIVWNPIKMKVGKFLLVTVFENRLKSLILQRFLHKQKIIL